MLSPLRTSLPRSLLRQLRRGAPTATARNLCSFPPRQSAIIPILTVQNRIIRKSAAAFSTTPSLKKEDPAASPPPTEDQEFKVYTYEEFEPLTSTPSPSHLVIDVREPSELQKSGIIPNSINIPLHSSPDALFLPEETFEERFGVKKPAKEMELVFSCKAGIRSTAAARIARQAGYERVGSFNGGWVEWAGVRGEKMY